jgi:hypothetical protein
MKTPFMSLVSKSWAVWTGNLSIQMMEDPANFTILSLDIDDWDLREEDLDYLGDDENETELPRTAEE